MNERIKSPIKLFMLKDIDFVIWLFGAVISLTGYMVPLFYLPSKLLYFTQKRDTDIRFEQNMVRPLA